MVPPKPRATRFSNPGGKGPDRRRIESAASPLAAKPLELERGAMAASGDSHRFLLKNGVRYGHVLNPRTGWPIPGLPRSVTVAASSCTEAGLLATAALLQAPKRRGFCRCRAYGIGSFDRRAPELGAMGRYKRV